MPELQFKGKEFVYNHHLTVPFRPLEMQDGKGIGAPRLDGNLIVHGDNLHALKALLPMYAGKVDCIFIDPPYNTGNEGWCYNDNVNSPMIKEWLDSNPIGLEDGLRHDKWACMMWPRLKLLYELLAEAGSFWMTLDDNESHRARLILDELFGADNFVADVAWKHTQQSKNDERYFSRNKNNILCYRKSEQCQNFRFNRTDEDNTNYSNPDDDPQGAWRSGDVRSPSMRPSLKYPIVTPSGNSIAPPDNGWRWSEAETVAKIASGEIKFSNDETRIIRKIYLSKQAGRTPENVWASEKFGTSRMANSQLTGIFEGNCPFDTPKPVELVSSIIEVVANPDALILDSFAGSGTTAHAVLAANARDGGNRRFILVEGEDYADTLTAERVRRVIKGYSFKGTQREELLREPITFSKLRNANTLLEKVQQIETLDGPKFDRIKPTVKDGALIVTGERDCEETAPGLGGEFTYCTLGAAIDVDSILSGEGLPDVPAIAGLLWHTATATPLDVASIAPAADIAEGLHKLGTHGGRTYWLLYTPDLAWLKSGAAALSLSMARSVAATAEGNHLVFAPAKFVSRELLARERLDVDYAPLPFALYRLETA